MLGRPAGFDHIKPLNGWTMHHNAPLTPPIYLEDRPFLGHGSGYEIPRPASTNSLPNASMTQYYQQRLPAAPGQQFQLPALSTLASLAVANYPVGARSVYIS